MKAQRNGNSVEPVSRRQVKESTDEASSVRRRTGTGSASMDSADGIYRGPPHHEAFDRFSCGLSGNELVPAAQEIKKALVGRASTHGRYLATSFAQRKKPDTLLLQWLPSRVASAIFCLPQCSPPKTLTPS